MSWTNADRAATAEQCAELHARLTRSTCEDGHTQLIDLLCNLRHLADREGWNWIATDRTAEGHHRAEVDEAREEANRCES
jgi:hypothetical protein